MLTTVLGWKWACTTKEETGLSTDSASNDAVLEVVEAQAAGHAHDVGGTQDIVCRLRSHSAMQAQPLTKAHVGWGHDEGPHRVQGARTHAVQHLHNAQFKTSKSLSL